MFCGLCVESCPFDAIEMSHDYELARTTRPISQYDLLASTCAASAGAPSHEPPMRRRSEPAAEPASPSWRRR